MTTGVTLGTRRSQRGFPFLLAISILFILVAIGLFVFELVNFSQGEDRLPADLTIAGVQVGGLTAPEAVAEFEQVYASPVTLYYEDNPILLDPASVGFRTSRETMLAEALAVGDTQAAFWRRFYNHLFGQQQQQAYTIELSAEYQESLLEQFLQDIAARYDKPPGAPVIDLSTLTVHAGSPGFKLDIDHAMEQVDAALRDPINRTVVLPTQSEEVSQPGLDALRELIISYLNSEGFIYDGQTTIASIYIMDLQTGEEINILGDVAFSAASTIKIPIMIDFYRHLTFEPTQDEAWLLANSLLCSNNASSNLIVQLIGGGTDTFPGLVSVTNTAQYIGARNTYINAPFDLGVENQEFGSVSVPPTSPNPNFDTEPDPFNQTTAEDLGTLLTMIYDCANYGSGLMAAFPDGQFNQRECQQMLELMSGNDLKRLLQAGIPQGVRISHKNGWITDMVGDSGVVFPPNGHDYVISVFIWEEAEFQNFERLWPLLEEISRATWNYFNPDNPLPERRSDIPATAQTCEGNYLPPDAESVNLDNIDSWKTDPD